MLQKRSLENFIKDYPVLLKHLDRMLAWPLAKKELDEKIVPLCYALNGFVCRTYYSCAGHEQGDVPYVTFDIHTSHFYILLNTINELFGQYYWFGPVLTLTAQSEVNARIIRLVTMSWLHAQHGCYKRAQYESLQLSEEILKKC